MSRPCEWCGGVVLPARNLSGRHCFACGRDPKSWLQRFIEWVMG